MANTKPRSKNGSGEREKIAFFADKSLVEQIDGIRERLKKESPGLDVSRTDALRFLILKGLGVVSATATTETK